jgi:hypothetical protein
MAKKKPAKKKAAKKKSAPKKKASAAKKPVRRKKPARRRGSAQTNPVFEPNWRARKGLGPDSGGQSGDTEGLSENELTDSESVAELAEEGPEVEAEAVSGVENVPDADEGPVRTHEVPEDDVPEEYREKDF